MTIEEKKKLEAMITPTGIYSPRIDLVRFHAEFAVTAEFAQRLREEQQAKQQQAKEGELK